MPKVRVDEYEGKVEITETIHDSGGEVDDIPTSSDVDKYPWETLTPEVCARGQRILCFYGPSGSGKTKLLGQFPNNLILGCDPGDFSGALPAAQYKPLYLKIQSYDHLLELLPTLREGYNNKQFDRISIDSLTYFTKTTMGDILKVCRREIPRFEEWNLLVERIRRLMVLLTDIGADIIFTATDSFQKNEITGQLIGGPDLPGKLAKELPQTCDVVARLYVQAGLSQGRKIAKYMYTVIPDDMFFAKDRTGKLEIEGEVTVSKDRPTLGYETFKVIFD